MGTDTTRLAVAPVAARGFGSQVTVNLKATEAVALGQWLDSPDKWTCDKNVMDALAKLRDAAERATVPWVDRGKELPF